MTTAARSSSRKALRHLAALPAAGGSGFASSSRTALSPTPTPCSPQHSLLHNITFSSKASSTAPYSTTALLSSPSSSASSSDPSSDYPHLAVPPIARSSPAIYVALIPHTESILTSLLARLNLSTNDNQKLLLSQLSSALTHPSWVALRDSLIKNAYKRQSLGASLANRLDASSKINSVPQHNATLAALGNSLLGMIVSEYFHLTYPNLPNRVLKAALSAHAGPQTASDVAVEFGLGAKGVLKWDPSGQQKSQDKDISSNRRSNSKEILSEAMRAIVGLIFQTRGLAQTRSFVLAHFLSRLPLPPPISSGPVLMSSGASSASHPLAALLKFADPKRALALVLQRYNLERPQSRLIAETGRLSQNAVFGVGVFSGNRKIGEGWGSAIRMAEYRAAEDALRRLYLAPSPALTPEEVPSSTLDHLFQGRKSSRATSSLMERALPESQGRDIWAVGEDEEGHDSNGGREYRPRSLGESEITFGSRA